MVLYCWVMEALLLLRQQIAPQNKEFGLMVLLLRAVEDAEDAEVEEVEKVKENRVEVKENHVEVKNRVEAAKVVENHVVEEEAEDAVNLT